MFKLLSILFFGLLLGMQHASAQQSTTPDSQSVESEIAAEEDLETVAAPDGDSLEKREKETSANTDKSDRPAPEKNETPPVAQESSKSTPPKEVFKPTEEISEDSPVPFPVDI